MPINDDVAPLRFLHLEDDDDDAVIVARALARDAPLCEIRRASNRDEFLTALEADPPDLVIADYRLPGYDGAAALKDLTQRHPQIPFLFVTGTVGEERAVEIVQSGASDYVLKDNLTRLGSAVRRALDTAAERSARREAERALAESQRFIRGVVDMTPSVVYVYDVTAQRATFVNRQVRDILGYTEDDVLRRGLPFLEELVHPADLAALRRHRRAVETAAAGEILEAELLARTADGRWRWLRTRDVRFADDPSGRPRLILGTIQDVTEGRRAQQRLAAQHSIARLLAEAGSWEEVIRRLPLALAEPLRAPVVEFWRIAPGTEALSFVEGRYAAELPASEWIAQARALAFRSGEGLLGTAWRTLQIEAVTDLPGDARFIRRALAEKAGHHEAVAVPVHLEGRVAGVLLFSFWQSGEMDADLLRLLDLLARQLAGFWARKEAESQQRAAEDQLREQGALLDNAQEAIVVHGLDGRVTSWNKGAERLYGLPGRDVVGREASTVLYLGSPRELAQARATVASDGTWAGVLHQRTRANKEVTVQSHWTLLRDDSGSPRAILIVNTDITEAHRLEAKFLRLQRLESLGFLVSGIAHDLNNVLSPLVMASQVLHGKVTDDRGRRMLEVVDASATRAADLVRQMLSFARGNEGERTFVQPRHVLRDVEQMMRESLPKSIQIVTEAGPDLWNLHADATQLHQVLLNLCVNARDALPTGGRIQIRAVNTTLDASYAAMRPECRPGPHVVFTVSDTGTGIPPEVLERIFEPFFTTKAEGKGTGLGLSTVAGIVKSHGGFLEVDSEPDQGSAFRVYLPARPASAEEAMGPIPAEAAVGRGETVLLVDDEAAIRDITTEALESLGYAILTAGDGAEGVALYAMHRARVSIVVTDMDMPVMDGASLIHALRRMNPAVRIVATSGLKENETVARLSGALGFVAKPYTIPRLVVTVRRVLDEGTSGPPPIIKT
jgi:two-component system cell cycle sensor histidine kinase/response regulator CckA